MSKVLGNSGMNVTQEVTIVTIIGWREYTFSDHLNRTNANGNVFFYSFELFQNSNYSL